MKTPSCGSAGFASQAVFLSEVVDCDRQLQARIPIDEVDGRLTRLLPAGAPGDRRGRDRDDDSG